MNIVYTMYDGRKGEIDPVPTAMKMFPLMTPRKNTFEHVHTCMYSYIVNR